MAELSAEERLLDALVGENARDDTRIAFRRKLRNGELDERMRDLEWTSRDFR